MIPTKEIKEKLKKTRVVVKSVNTHNVGTYKLIGKWWKAGLKKYDSKNLCFVFKRFDEPYMVISRQHYLELSETYGRMISPPYFGTIWMDHSQFQLMALKVEDFLHWTKTKIKRRRVLKRKPTKKLVRKSKPGFSFGTPKKKTIKRIKRLKR